VGLDDEPQQGEQRLVVGEHLALVVDDGQVFAVRIDHRTELGARGAHESATRAALAWRSTLIMSEVWA